MQWAIFAKTNSEFVTVLVWWDRAKAMVKTIALIFSIYKKQIQTDLEQVLQKERERLEILIGQCYTEQLEKELDCILKRQIELLLKKSESHPIRARIPHFGKHEPNISYYARMEKIQSEGNTIQSLYDKYGIQQCETSQVLKITEAYYSDLFRAGKTNKQYQSEILNKPKVKISQNKQSFCDKDFELTELEEGMKKLPVGRSPGLDGLPVEFYRKMWPNLKLDFLEMVKEVRNTKNLSDSQNKGVIRLIFKKEDRSYMKFYRPISLLNVDVKVITKTLALRLGRVLPSIISNDQTCIPGRNIASNLHTLNGIVKYASSKNIEAAILFLDQEKAFDRVDHQFLITTLKHLNFGYYFTSWIEIILKDITSCVKINGFLTDEIEIRRGVHQGDPLSARLYVIIAEVLGNQIRSNQSISGITIRNI